MPPGFPRLAAPAMLAAAALLAFGPAAGARPAPRKAAPQVGVASVYGGKEAGRRTADGERMKPAALTAASPTLPLGAVAKVTDTHTGRSVKVRVTDRGPYAKGRILDVTPKAARDLGMPRRGIAKVVVKPLTPGRATGAR